MPTRTVKFTGYWLTQWIWNPLRKTVFSKFYLLIHRFDIYVLIIYTFEISPWLWMNNIGGIIWLDGRIHFSTHYIISLSTFMRTCLETLSIQNACHVYSLECMSRAMFILSITYYAIYGTVYHQFTYFAFYDCEYTYISYCNHQIANTNH